MVTSSVPFAMGQDAPSQGRSWRGLSRRLARGGLLRLGAVFAAAGLAFQSAKAQETPDHPQCVSQLWAAGTQLGRAEAVARHDTTDDAGMLDDMLDAGLHIEQANALCAQEPPPWPAWPNWRETRDQLATMAEKFQNGHENRQQLAIGLAVLQQGLAYQLAFRVLPTHIEHDATCVEIYMRLGVTLGYAQAATRISGRILPDAVERLRKAISLIYQTREMPSRCLDFKGLLPSINAALKTPNDPSIAGHLDDIVHAADVVAAPLTE